MKRCLRYKRLPTEEQTYLWIFLQTLQKEMGKRVSQAKETETGAEKGDLVKKNLRV